MSQMLADISRIVNEDISPRVTQYDVLFEAITNAIHANATEIKCYLNTTQNQLKEEEEDKELGAIKVDTIKIIDNGDGLTDKNFASFSTYRTEHKKELGCKGVGRFVFLKIFKNVIYNSRLKEEQEERKFKFDFNFDTENLTKESTVVKSNETELTLSGITSKYYDNTKKNDRRIELDITTIREKVLMNLIPTLFFYKQKGTYITIEIHNEYDNSTNQISSIDIPDFQDKIFEVQNKDGNIFKFNLHHKIYNNAGSLNAYYCANNRTVCEFSDKDLKIAMPYGYSGFMLLESDYLNTHANNERNDFDIFPVKTDLFSTLSWEMINSFLKKEISELVKEGIPETQKRNIEKLQEIQDERPYLMNYIEEEDIEMAGFLDKKHIIEKAKKGFDVAKEKVLVNAGKADYSDEELNDAIQLAQNELVSYINDRVQVIERLKTLVDKSERVEKIIHNLFMEMRTSDDYYCVGKNNLWLLDDRYTTYSYVASDKRIREVLKGIDEENGDTEILDDKPDLSLFFSHNPKNPERLKSVLIEIKPFDYISKPDRKKFAGIQQLLDYVKAFKAKDKIDEVSAFLITEIDSKLEARLREDDYTPLFSTENPIFHRFYKETGISIFVISATTLIKDAEARNKVFLDIIRKQTKLNRLIQKTLVKN